MKALDFGFAAIFFSLFCYQLIYKEPVSRYIGALLFYALFIHNLKDGLEET